MLKVHYPRLIKVMACLCQDISSNLLEFKTLCALRKILPEGAELVDHGSHPFEEALNTLTHGVGFLLACIGAVVLLYNSYDSPRTVYYACCIYAFTLLFLYLSSTVYHSVYANKFWTDVLKILDHAAIYLLIAGSYTPYCMISFGDHPYGNLILFTEWACACLGILMIFITLRVDVPFADVIELVLYIFMGWAISFVWEEANEKVGEDAIRLLMYGKLWNRAEQCGCVVVSRDRFYRRHGIHWWNSVLSCRKARCASNR